MHLMGEAIRNLRDKGNMIFEDEIDGALLAILLHDIGHGPFSHALEHSILKDTDHEDISKLLMKKLHKEIGGGLDFAIQIFEDSYHRRFLHQLVSGQLDIDRMDYLQRDCFFTGVSEGSIGASRIIKMLDLHEDELVVEAKGIYSVENFLNARRLMYWQVYLHKASISAEQMLISIFRRAKHLTKDGRLKTPIPQLAYFLDNDVDLDILSNEDIALQNFTGLDDADVWAAIKIWQYDSDTVLSLLCGRLIQRKLFKIHLSNEEQTPEFKKEILENTAKEFNISAEDAKYLCLSGDITNSAYISQGKTINIKTKDEEIVDIANASELPNIKAISKIVRKYYLCHPKDVYL